MPYIIFRQNPLLSFSRFSAQLKFIIQSVIEQTNRTQPNFFPEKLEHNIYTIYGEKATSMYGFYLKKQSFVRVVFFDPRLTKL